MWGECLRVLKPGGHLVAFGACRTHHRIWCAIEDAGFEVRDTLQWLFGTGFPKSADVEKSMAQEIRTQRKRAKGGDRKSAAKLRHLDRNARNYSGGTALKPAYEPILLARKPLAGTVAGTVQEFGTGGLNVDGCRVGDEDTRRANSSARGVSVGKVHVGRTNGSTKGRWPPNILLSGLAVAELSKQNENAPRYFPTFKYQAKASRKEREAGCEALPALTPPAVETQGGHDKKGLASPRAGAGRTAKTVRNHHPTVKPIALMQWLVRLVTPPGGTVLDPFTGSGTTGIAAKLEGFEFIGMEQSEEYARIARARIEAA